MGLEIFFTEDIRNALLAANEASTSTAGACVMGSDPVTLRAYLEGYRAALTTMALAFGLSPTIMASRRKTLEVEAGTVSDQE